MNNENNEINDNKNTTKETIENITQNSAPSPVPTPTVINPTQTVVTPTHTNVISTEKKKNSNLILFVLVIIFGLFVINIDKILSYFNENTTPYISDTEDDSKGSNLIDGMIKIDENKSFIKIDKIKFYNFIKGSDTSLILNYVSDRSYKNVGKEEIYLEVYNSNKELLYKELFEQDNIDKDAIRQHAMNVTNDVYESAFYLLVKIYTREEKESKTNLICKYSINNSDTTLLYKKTFIFTNNSLSSYEIDMNYTSTNESESSKYKEEIKKEYLSVVDYNFNVEYSDNSLSYKVDLNELPKEYSPLYIKGTIKKTISNKETLKKWICE